ncbi:MAG: chemotaxis-specific protein-glutamate methyltransferase CheB [Polyangiaceae bacterium]
MRKVRLLIVDDCVVVRRLLSTLLSSEPDIEVAGIAADGAIALTKIKLLKPDIVTLDVEMPGMDGLETLAAIRKRFPLLPVLMCSARSDSAAHRILEAIAPEATDYVTAPRSASSREAAIEHVRAHLIPKIRELCARAAARRAGVATVRPTTPRSVRRARGGSPVGVVAIGASTGGPSALTSLLGALPSTLPCPVVVVQHMPPRSTSHFARRLAAASSLVVREARGGEILEPGRVYIAPGDHHLRVVRDGARARLEIDQLAAENSCRPAVDVLFRSAADAYGARALGIVLTGMGQDGLRGAARIKGEGGHIVVQDETSSVVWGMPGIVARAGLADAVLPLGELAYEIRRRAARDPSGARSVVAPSRRFALPADGAYAR